MYTTKGIAIERIYPDLAWQLQNIPELQYFYDTLLPKFLFPHMKPSFVLYYTVLQQDVNNVYQTLLSVDYSTNGG